MKVNIMNIYFEVRNRDTDHYFKYYDFNMKFKNISLSFNSFLQM